MSVPNNIHYTHTLCYPCLEKTTYFYIILQLSCIALKHGSENSYSEIWEEYTCN